MYNNKIWLLATCVHVGACDRTLWKYKILCLQISTPTGSQDFIEIRNTFTFSESTERIFSFNVSILEDEIAESPEEFSVVVLVAEEGEEFVFIQTDEVPVMILDNDGMCVFFFNCMPITPVRLVGWVHLF